MPEYRTNALILALRDYGEADRIVTFFSQDLGKMKGIAKGAKKSRKRFGAAMDLFSHVSLSFFSKEAHGLVRLNHCQLQEAFSSLHKDIIPMGYGSYLAELTEEMSAEGVTHREIFDLLWRFFFILNTLPPREEYLRIFEIRLLVALGYQPHLSHCTVCRKTVEKEDTIKFSISRGGLVCSLCAAGEKDAYPISIGTVRLLQQAYALSLDKVQRLFFSAQALTESREIMPRFIQYQVGKELKAAQFLKQIQVSSF
ncbi:MAG: DNA repair protein RecO [Deltaproteobacteria bacterium]|nr:DNA repair protein RecO [Deltaproteobacteria bacterium]